MATTEQAPEKLPLPRQGGSHVRQGATLKRVAHTAPAKDAVATVPPAPSAPATPKE